MFLFGSFSCLIYLSWSYLRRENHDGGVFVISFFYEERWLLVFVACSLVLQIGRICCWKKIWTGKKKENHKTLKEIWKNKCGYLYVGLLSAELWESIHLSSQKYKFRYSTITSEAMEVNTTHPRKQLLFPRICPTPFRLSSSLADLLSRERAINSVAPWTKDLKAGH